MNARTENSRYKDKIIRMDPDSPDLSVIERAASIIRQGGVVVFPARSMYGLAADALSASAVEKIFEIKKRSPVKPLLVLVPEAYDLHNIITDIPESALRIMKQFWPGKITIILNAREHLPEKLTAGTRKIGIRIPGNRIAALLADMAGSPITGTSANISDTESCVRISDLPEKIIEAVDLVLDAGELDGGKGSTVIDATGERIKILREGNVPASDLGDFI